MTKEYNGKGLLAIARSPLKEKTMIGYYSFLIYCLQYYFDIFGIDPDNAILVITDCLRKPCVPFWGS